MTTIIPVEEREELKKMIAKGDYTAAAKIYQDKYGSPTPRISTFEWFLNSKGLKKGMKYPQDQMYESLVEAIAQRRKTLQEGSEKARQLRQSMLAS